MMPLPYSARLRVLCLLSLFSLLAWMPVCVWGQQPASVSVSFRVRNAGLWVEGSFAETRATVQYNPARPDMLRISGTAAVRTIRTGIAARDRHLLAPEYFDAERFPEIRIESQRVQTSDGKTFTGTFLLNIKGIGKTVEVPFRLEGAEKKTLSGSFAINRQDFGVGKNSWILSDQVEVSVSVQWD